MRYSLKYFLPVFLFIFSVLLFQPLITSADISDDLVKAVKENNLEKVKELIDKGADVNAVFDLDGEYVKSYGKGTTVLMISAMKGSIDIVKLLIEKGANVNAVSERGWTAMKLAEGYKRTEIVELLKKADFAMEKDTTLDKKGAIPSQTKAIAEDKDKKPAMLARVDAKGKVLLAQADQTNGEYVYGQGQKVDFNSLPTVSIDYLSERYKATYNDFEITSYPYKNKPGEYTQYTISLEETATGEKVGLVVGIGLDKNNNMDCNKVTIGFVTQKGEALVDQEHLLDELAKLYYEATGGKQMRSILITAETGYHEGKWLVNFIIMPMEGTNRPITQNIPCLYVPYYDSNVYTSGVKMIR